MLAGALRSIVGRLSVEEIIRDRAAFAQQVAEEAEASLTGQGLVLDTFQIQDITAEGTYLPTSAGPRRPRVKQDAAIAEANARQAAEQARLEAEEEIAVAQRDLALSRPRSRPRPTRPPPRPPPPDRWPRPSGSRRILAEQEKVAERQAALKERQLDTEVRKPADAARYRSSRRPRRSGHAAIAAPRPRGRPSPPPRRTAEQSSVSPVRARRPAGRRRRRASPRVTRRRPRSWPRARPRPRRWTSKPTPSPPTTTPPCCRCWSRCCRRSPSEVAAPLAAIDKLTVISTDGAGEVPKQVTNNVVQTLELLKNTTGVDLQTLVSRYTDGNGQSSVEQA